MKLINPRIGPVLGLVKTSSARIMCGIQCWNNNEKPNNDKPNCGWIRIRRSGSNWQKAKQFRFNANFYYTGVIELTYLELNTKYEYQMAYTSDYSEDEIENLEYWEEIKTYSFLTKSSSEFCFCFGSCLRNNDDSRVGKVLKTVHKMHQDTPLDMMLWLGDQVYNDKLLGATLHNSSKKDFTKLYEDFFCNTHVKRLLPEVPNYMVMDDHEIEDSFKHGADEYGDTRFNWLNKDKDRLINGINAFYSYQASHGPIYDTQPSEQEGVSFVKGQSKNQVPVRHYASINFGDVGLFLMDTRKERGHRGLISSEQEEHLKKFLSSDCRVKLVASSVTFLADNHSKPNKSDNWKKAPSQRERILNYIISKDIQNVIFLSGDIHSHFAASLKYQGQSTTIHQLVSGSLFWPTSFLMNRIRWFENDVRFDKSIYGASGFSLSQPLSETDCKFYASNAVGYVEIIENSLIFKVLRQNGDAVIETRLPLTSQSTRTQQS
ncbi:alkaline phosphatase family protein [Vibrio sp. Of7-15]|uniref:alkaline phosphatase D family protein n=1 Tax=Vibrio sp. Of7-15 TaxID=2724879 RepID=UPI001EF1F87D|nr:alkaline phosphatase D family protein [Vibrio sp. Of7-15]MCG7495620.1 alkaline phosphatase family protein [Vibrio sp. Of7-15]